MSLRLGDTIISGIPTDETIKTTLIGNAVYSSDTENTRINDLIGTSARTTSTYSSQRNRDRITSWTEIPYTDVFSAQSGFSFLSGSGANANCVKVNTYLRCIQAIVYFCCTSDVAKSTIMWALKINNYKPIPLSGGAYISMGGVYAGRAYSGQISTKYSESYVYCTCSSGSIPANSPIKLSGMWFY